MFEHLSLLTVATPVLMVLSIRFGHSTIFRLFHEAILKRQQITCRYEGRYREVCPYVLGHKDGSETALVYQFGGESSRDLPDKGEWRCFSLAKVRDAAAALEGEALLHVALARFVVIVKPGGPADDHPHQQK